MNLRYAIALSGGIASGKSTVASLLKLYGYHIICADEIAHTMLDSSAKEVVAVFGNGILSADCGDCALKIDRQKLGKIVFADKVARSKLESILHPKIRKEILQQAQKQESKKVLYFIDIPLFFETKHYPIQQSLLIYATKDLQIERLKKRNGLSEQDALCRIESQMPLEDKRAMASYVIDNSGSLEELQSAVETYLRSLQKLKI